MKKSNNKKVVKKGKKLPKKYVLDGLGLGDTQRVFTLMIADLVQFAYSNGYELTYGDAYRDPRAFGSFSKNKPGVYGRHRSNHKRRLAVDFNLFKEGKYLTQTEDYLELGLYWESIGGSWGGRFKDGNHFSVLYKGVR